MEILDLSYLLPIIDWPGKNKAVVARIKPKHSF